ncbi:phospholipase D-like domain-containing protein [Marmoricola endophyticus]|uniref:phospholipase D-like domain-containing protein n=1 Tax=Marmoricola endophyticus TaxID=2040280 RepID=UPI00166DEE84|nr:phospholipase D-like domain-containing protein [Marmoricola endophyticus]
MSTRLGRLAAVAAVVLGLLGGELVLAGTATAASPAAVVQAKQPGPAKQKAAQQKAAQKKVARQKAAQKRAARAAKAARAAAVRKAAAARKLAQERAWTPHDATYFNYPLARRAADRFRIRNQVLAAVKASPAGSEIRLSTFTFIDATITEALVAAHRRGVSVQVVVNRYQAKKSKPFRTLSKALNKRPRGTVVTPDTSFVSTCRGSCRGSAGNQHTKIYLFSQVGHAGFVSMIASANLTRFAAVGQWNHLDVTVGRATYTRLRGVFEQMTLDAPSPFTTFVTKKLTAWVFPRPGTTPANDPVAADLNRISCVGPAPRVTKTQARRIKAMPKAKQVARSKAVAARRTAQRTSIRISMYAWHGDRGVALAKLIRQRADQGCDVRIIYSFASKQVMRVLRAKGHGHGPIPMRRSTTSRGGKVADYSHSKYVAVSGTWNNTRGQQVWTGSMNFTALGFVSDDIVARYPGPRTYTSYLANFNRVWAAKSSTRPARA